ncbi:SDR family NAD(P)-dependent oxidoreductase [Salibacterium aidingense]|uniref:SDR family NAD(P)-dependent oxidoreductase n=1 Tax=Salibacterium aidingense TaxID=384933 RepID=UPI000403CBA9|nr:SDR family NAD(P)-dependent oxidoreductase [Salibacterium aidingense]
MAANSVWNNVLFSPAPINEKKLSSELRGKTILITGASSGIGEQLAYQLAGQEVQMILVARREEQLHHVQREIEKETATASIYPVDLRHREEREKLLAYLVALPDGLDIIVSNAGHSILRSIEDSLNRYHDFTRTMDINYLAPVHLLLSLIPLLERKHGHIINISGINALLLPVPYGAAYQASKSAFDAWLRSAAPELREKNVAVTSIYLPLVRTPMIQPTAVYQNIPGVTADHAADIIRRALYTKKKKVRPWWLPFAEFASLFGRRLFEPAMQRLVRKKGKDQ